MKRMKRVLLVASLLAVLAACGGGGSSPPPPPPDANPTGYYDVSGTASVDDGAGGTLSITDLQGMVNGNTFIAMSDAQGLAYAGTITAINVNSFTATVSVYQAGALLSISTVSGTITQGSSIVGTLTGTGPGNGAFGLTYAQSNALPAALSRVQNDVNEQWITLVGGSANIASALGFIVNVSGNIIHNNSPIDGVFDACVITNGDISPISGTNVYTVTMFLSNCNTPAVNGSYTGLGGTCAQTVTDDRLILVVSNASYSVNGEFERGDTR